jgi:hypothetical protein
MTAKEMQRRNGKAQGLRVIQVDEGNFFVESSDGRVAYKAQLSDNKVSCTCQDYLKHQQDPDFLCKHLLAIVSCLPAGTEQKKEFLAKRQPKLDDRFIKNIEGKDFVLYAGLLDLAHQKGLVTMKVEIIQNPTPENGHMAIVRALAESRQGEAFMDVGDANPSNCNAKVARHLLRMASTRAKARCLRDFTNVGMTALEELGDFSEVIEERSAPGKPAKAAARKVRTAPAQGTSPKAEPEPEPAPSVPKAPETTPKMSEAQKRAIHNLSRRRGLSLEELEKLAMEAYGTALGDLNVADASQMIRHLQQSA